MKRNTPALDRRTVLKTIAVAGAASVFGAGAAAGSGSGTGEPQIDLSTGTTDFVPDDWGDVDDDWTVTASPDGTTGQAVSIEPDPQWATSSSANWIDYDGSGGHPFYDDAADPIGDYTYENEFTVRFPGCRLRIHEWGVDNDAEDEGRGVFLDGPNGTQLVTAGSSFDTLMGPVGPVELDPGDHTLRVELYNTSSVSGLLMVADVVCDPPIDIKPCSDPNAINPNSNGVVAVAVRGTENFDPAAELEVGSLRFGSPDVVDNGGGAEPAHAGHEEDVIPCGGDGIDDLVVHFPVQNTGFDSTDDCGKLVGETIDGYAFSATDSVTIVGGGNGGGNGGGGNGGGGNGGGNGA